MIDLDEIETTINTLENGFTTFENCEKLAYLYICRENLKRGLNALVDNVMSELDDILPYYMKYRDIKRRYQTNQAIDNEVVQGIQDVCQELQEFIDKLYYSTDMNKERVCIRNMVHELAEKYKD